MTGKQLVQFRKQNGLTQVQAAQALGVSQTYLSLLENEKRPLSVKLKEKAVRVFGLPPTEMPVETDLSKVTDDQLAADLAALGYKGFSHLKPTRPKNPVTVLVSALNADNRDARLVEALPWVLLNFADMKWDELVRVAKTNDLQNRLGFVTTVARQVAESKGDKNTATKLKRHEAELERSLLFREETLCNESMTNAERKWLAAERPETARHWRLLTNLSPEHLSYAK